MNKKYDQEFHQDIDTVLKELWKDVCLRGVDGIGMVLANKKYIDYLDEQGIIKVLSTHGHRPQWRLQLTTKGHEVFEKYGGWENYKRKVIDNKKKVEKAKELAIKYWWLPVIISLISLIVAIVAIII